jgi:hypothetical protein
VDIVASLEKGEKEGEVGEGTTTYDLVVESLDMPICFVK